MIRILLIDDQKLIRQGLKALLELDPDIQVVGSASDGQSGIELVNSLHPDVVLVDIRMPGMDGVTATRIICERFTETKVIILSGYDDEEYLADALRSGAKGYLLKDTPAEELVNVIQSVHKGYSQIGPGLLEKINSRITSGHHNSIPVLTQLTTPNALEMEVERQLKTFEPQALKEVVRLAIEQKTVVELLAYVNNLLKEHLNNLSALYLAGALWSNSGQENQTLALHYLKMGFKEGLKQKISPEDLLLFYQASVNLEPSEAFSWLTQVNAPWNNEEGLSFLLQEAAQLFGKYSQQYRTILVLLQLKAMFAFSEKCNALALVTKYLNKSFE